MRKILYKNLGVPFHCPHVATTRFRSRQVSFRHTHDFFEIFLVTAGSGTHHINKGSVELATGQLAVIVPEDCHHFSTRRGEGMTIINIAMAAPWWKSFHQLMGTSLQKDWHRLSRPSVHLLLSQPEQKEMRTIFERLGASHSRHPIDMVEALARVSARFESVHQGAIPSPPAWLEEWKWKIINAGEAVAEPIHHWQKLSGRSPEHLARSCRLFYNCTPTDLLNRFRIDRAKMLLGSTDDKVITIGLACGFGNLANFYRNFSAQSGMTPRAWRQGEAATVPLPGTR